MRTGTPTRRRLGTRWLGFGVGLRLPHLDYVRQRWPALGFFEVVTEDFMDSHGARRRALAEIAERYPVVLHGLALSVGGCDRLDYRYLGRLRELADEVRAEWVSDHVGWTGVDGVNTHAVLPMPRTEESLRHLVRRIRTVQDALERPLVLKNTSSAFEFAASTLSEWEFLARMADEADCGLLLDVSNVHVSAVNHDFDPVEYLRALPHHRVVEMHLSGHTHHGTHAVASRDTPISDAVWELYRLAVVLTGGAPTVVEWDDQLPAFPVLLAELDKARRHAATALWAGV
ncbi:DUF692 domain-containing protein [Streptoalloteichus hindustanus]|uniref:Uncharacterized protein n=1 Tax=Streptoalloteichus hindustanus TaxID=2017 RepID=A0A1M5QCW0_STRHI|nr:DUF692 domain-containing protein [Streptoalloteichus hindustanus]SHH11750.1 hypothetical protein SAMN05444320_12324 [Streptoalloteichus hindustanus]